MAATVGSNGDASADATAAVAAGGATGDTFDNTGGIMTGAEVGRGAIAVAGGAGATAGVDVGDGVLEAQAANNELRMMKRPCCIFM